jgi:hypothetical protein
LDPIENRTRPAAKVAAASWAVAGAAVALAVAPLEPNLLEEGIVVHIAERLAGGEALYGDVMIHTGPLPYELLGLLFRVFGIHIELARAVVVLLHGIATGACYAVARRSEIGSIAHPAAAVIAVTPVLLFPMFSIYYYTNLAFDLGLISVYAAIRGLDSGRWAAVCGALVACVAFCKQSSGVVLAVALLPAFILCAAEDVRWRHGAAIVAGGAGTALVVLAGYASRGTLDAFVQSQIGFPLALVSKESFRLPLMNLWPPGVMAEDIRAAWILYLPNLYHLRAGLFPEIGAGVVAATQLLYALPFIALAAVSVRAVARRARVTEVFHGVFLVTMTANLLPQGDWGHLVVALPPAAVQLLLVAGAAKPISGRVRTWFAAGAVATALTSAATVAVWLDGIAGPPTFGPRVPLLPVSASNRGPAVPRVIRYLRQHTQPGEEILVPRAEPLLYFATETRNPTPFAGSFPGMREMLEPGYLSALDRVRYVVMSDIDTPGYRFADEVPRVQAYLERYFALPDDFPVDEASWLTVLCRCVDRGETAVDLLAERSRATAWVRGRDGRESILETQPPELRTRQLNRPLAMAMGAGGGGLDFDIEVPRDAVFHAGVGFYRLFSVEGPHDHPRGVTLSVAVRNGREFVRVGSARVDALRSGARWAPFEADLSPYGGQRVMLRLEAVFDRPLAAANTLTWWGSPRITRRTRDRAARGAGSFP